MTENLKRVQDKTTRDDGAREGKRFPRRVGRIGIAKLGFVGGFFSE